MARVLHLMKGEHTTEALAVIAAQVAAGDQVTVALLEAAAPPLPASVTIQRVPAELPYDRLVELVFASDHVVTW